MVIRCYSHRPEEFRKLREHEAAMFDVMLRFRIMENQSGSTLWKVKEETERAHAQAVISE